MGNIILQEEAFTRLLILGDAIKSLADAKRRGIGRYMLDCDRRASCKYCPLNCDDDYQHCEIMSCRDWISWIQNYAKNFDIVFNPNRLEALEELKKAKKASEDLYYTGPAYESNFTNCYSILDKHISEIEKLLK